MRGPFATPAAVETAATNLDGEGCRRLIVTLRAPGCAWARGPEKGCTNCGFASTAGGLTTEGAPVGPAEYGAQLEAALAGRDLAAEGVRQVDLFVSGSFYNDDEVPPPARAVLLARLGREPLVRRVLVESRPEHVAPEKVEASREALGEGPELEVGLGLESADDRVRQVLVRKGFGKEAFERAVSALAAGRARLLAYVLVKPLGLDEAAALLDSVESARYVFEVAAGSGVAARVALQPVFVAPETPLAEAHARGEYAPPRLWTVVEVVRRAHGLGPLTVGLSDEGLAPAARPDSCPECRPALLAALVRYNETADLAALAGLDCRCRPSLRPVRSPRPGGPGCPRSPGRCG